MEETTTTIRRRPFILALWSLSLLCFPLLSIFGRSLQLTIIRHFSSQEMSFVLGPIMVGLLLTYAISLFKTEGRQYLWHLLWVGALSFFLYISLPFVEKIHIALFGMFGFFSQQLFKQGVAIGFCLAISFSDELLQHFLAARVGDWRDVWLNLFSACLGMLLACILQENSGKFSVKDSEEQ